MPTIAAGARYWPSRTDTAGDFARGVWGVTGGCAKVSGENGVVQRGVEIIVP